MTVFFFQFNKFAIFEAIHEFNSSTVLALVTSHPAKFQVDWIYRTKATLFASISLLPYAYENFYTFAFLSILSMVEVKINRTKTPIIDFCVNYI